MPITSDDIKLLESERLTDTPDGGGRMTSREVIDGQVNNLFNDISRLDRTYGRVSLRKVFVAVQTALRELYAGSHVIVTNPPKDGSVHVTLFSTDNDDDERGAATDRIESYTISGPVSRMRLYDRHISGQRTLQCFQFPQDPLPEIAEVYSLSRGEQDPATFKQQFFRITRLEEEVRTFHSERVGQYSIRVLNLEIDAALQWDFEGYVPDPSDDEIERQYEGDEPNRPYIRDSNVADAARYFGIVPVAAAPTQGDTELTAESIFAPIVPATQGETPITDAEAGLGTIVLHQAGDEETQQVFSASGWSAGTDGGIPHFYGPNTGRYSVGCSILPGSLRIVQGSWSATDRGDGTCDTVGDWEVSVDYVTGLITMAKGSSNSSSFFYFTFTPAAAVSAVSESKAIPITDQNRQLNYTSFLRPLPAQRTVFVSYRALGKWYMLRDDGGGGLVPVQSGAGAGTVNYLTGSIAITVGYEPDEGSAVIIQWGTGAQFINRAGDVEQPDRHGYDLQVDNPPIRPGTLSITWTAATSAGDLVSTATDDGAGNLTGDATGRVVYATGQILLAPGLVAGYVDRWRVPKAGTSFTIDYEEDASVTDTFTPAKDGNGFVTLNLSQTPIRPGTLRVGWSTVRQITNSQRVNNNSGAVN